MPELKRLCCRSGIPRLQYLLNTKPHLLTRRAVRSCSWRCERAGCSGLTVLLPPAATSDDLRVARALRIHMDCVTCKYVLISAQV